MSAAVKADYSGHTCVEVSRSKSQVRFIPFDVSGLRVRTESAGKFDERFQEIQDYPVTRACSKYLNSARDLGATEEAAKLLIKVGDLPTGELDFVEIIAKSGGSGGNFGRPDGPTASSMIKELVLAGGMTDEEMFKKVQDTFKLDPKKFRYIQSMRCTLKGKGQDVPIRIKEKK